MGVRFEKGRLKEKFQTAFLIVAVYAYACAAAVDKMRRGRLECIKNDTAGRLG
jgi:hypothetical protein